MNVCNFICISFYWNPQYTRISDYDEFGLPRPQPFLWGNTNDYSADLHGAKNDEGIVTGPAEGWESYGPSINTVFKFPIGSDTDDMAAMKMTYMQGFSDSLVASPVVFDPNNDNTFYCFHDRVTQDNGTLFKWYFVEGGNATIDENWSDVGELTFATALKDSAQAPKVGTSTDGQYIYLASPGLESAVSRDRFAMVDLDGIAFADISLDDFYTPSNPNEAYHNGRVNRLYASQIIPGQALVGGEISCLLMMINTDRLVAGNTAEYVKWSNSNGDFFFDASWDPEATDATALWECNTRDFSNVYNGGLHSENWFDSNGVVIHNVEYLCLTSFVVLTQDGSGVAYCKVAEDGLCQWSYPLPLRGSSQICDSGTMYDGIYLGSLLFNGLVQPDVSRESVNWLAMDSAHGIITNEPTSVKEDMPSGFKVDSPFPNPANPLTTIGFSLPEQEHVTIDIYNIAGQKIETLVDREYDAGKHSLVWDGSEYAAGVYFCTIKSIGYLETRKMVLVK